MLQLWTINESLNDSINQPVDINALKFKNKWWSDANLLNVWFLVSYLRRAVTVWVYYEGSEVRQLSTQRSVILNFWYPGFGRCSSCNVFLGSCSSGISGRGWSVWACEGPKTYSSFLLSLTLYWIHMAWQQQSHGVIAYSEAFSISLLPFSYSFSFWFTVFGQASHVFMFVIGALRFSHIFWHSPPDLQNRNLKWKFHHHRIPSSKRLLFCRTSRWCNHNRVSAQMMELQHGKAKRSLLELSIHDWLIATTPRFVWRFFKWNIPSLMDRPLVLESFLLLRVGRVGEGVAGRGGVLGKMGNSKPS